MGQPIQSYNMLLQPHLVVEPFERWALDFVGPINSPSQQNVSILVYTNYVTKWVETKSLTWETDHITAYFNFQ